MDRQNDKNEKYEKENQQAKNAGKSPKVRFSATERALKAFAAYLKLDAAAPFVLYPDLFEFNVDRILQIVDEDSERWWRVIPIHETDKIFRFILNSHEKLIFAIISQVVKNPKIVDKIRRLYFIYTFPAPLD